MERGILLSVRPKWTRLIAGRQKTWEIRKSLPKIELPFSAFLYCTRNREGNPCAPVQYRRASEKYCSEFLPTWVVGEFVCDAIVYLGNIATDPWPRLVGSSHEAGKRLVTEGARLTEAELHAYAGGSKCYAWHISNLRMYDAPKSLSDFHVKRPPQSWCYVELPVTPLGEGPARHGRLIDAEVLKTSLTDARISRVERDNASNNEERAWMEGVNEGLLRAQICVNNSDTIIRERQEENL